MKRTHGFQPLELPFGYMRRAGTVYPTLIWDADTAILLDAGYPGGLPVLRAAMEGAGVPLASLKQVIITHHDIDHLGGLGSLLSEAPGKDRISAIHTPGHTPGHICLYLHESRTLVAGDALAVREGQLVPAPAANKLDGDLALRSLARLTPYDVQTVICYHGSPYEKDANARIRELAARG